MHSLGGGVECPTRGREGKKEIERKRKRAGVVVVVVVNDSPGESERE